jgi:hypothetical protein
MRNLPFSLALAPSAMASSQVLGGVQPFCSNRDAEYQMA